MLKRSLDIEEGSSGSRGKWGEGQVCVEGGLGDQALYRGGLGWRGRKPPFRDLWALGQMESQWKGQQVEMGWVGHSYLRVF